MNKRTLRAAALCPALLVLGGCSALGINFSDDKVQYEASNTRANLEVPPDLAPIPNDNRFEVPARPGVVSANAETARMEAAGEVKAERGAIVQRTVVSKMMRDGASRWLRVNADAEQLWTVVQDFWPSVGLVVRRQDPKTGYMETEWAENKAKLPQDIIRGTIGKVLDFAYSTGERDQYRCRIERNEDGTSDIFITHRSMVEVVTGSQSDSTMWQPGPADPTMEAEMLQRLALRIDSEFNPEAEPAAKAADIVQQQDLTKKEARSDVVKGADGKLEAVVLKEPFDRAWRTVGLVVDRMGFELVDRDRAAGYFAVRYLDPDYEAKVKSERGFFTRVFGSDKAVDVPEYRIRLGDEGSVTRVTVIGGDGNDDKTGVAPNILTLLAEQLR
ncbi:MAG: outer membrane protein assembly factor BamC [Sutterella sp.]|nr:outer membrane protein assembly factor BamC [Sutterella sp.]